MIVSDDVRDITFKYFNACVRDLKVKFYERLPPNEGPSGNVMWRIKSERSIADKLAARSRLHGGAQSRINDFVGIRLVLPHRGLMQLAVAFIRQWAADSGFSESEYFDGFSSNSDRNYRSIHVDFDLNSTLSTIVGLDLGLEVQITTYLQHFNSIISHQFSYHHGMAISADADIINKMNNLSKAIAFADEAACEIFSSRNIGAISA